MKQKLTPKGKSDFQAVVEFERCTTNDPVDVVIGLTRYLDVYGEAGLHDLVGFIKFGRDNNMDDHQIAATIGHDLSGAGSRGFLPRSNDYGKHAD